MALETVTLGGGRFWDLEAVFQQIRGVKSVQSGYAGGHTDGPTYEVVCGGETGHAEVVRVCFDTDILSYDQLLDVFFRVHQPMNTTSIDSRLASPHRSAIFYHSVEQKKLAQDVVKTLASVSGCKLTTEIKAATLFFPAEAEHQNFYKNHREDAYCREFILPKIIMSREAFKKRLAA